MLLDILFETDDGTAVKRAYCINISQFLSKLNREAYSRVTHIF